jgi:hypothetical protein
LVLFFRCTWVSIGEVGAVLDGARVDPHPIAILLVLVLQARRIIERTVAANTGLMEVGCSLL